MKVRVNEFYYINCCLGGFCQPQVFPREVKKGSKQAGKIFFYIDQQPARQQAYSWKRYYS
jgi:hypothetical protein